MAGNDSKLKIFYWRHPLVSHLILICLAAMLAGGACMIFLNVWTFHGKTSVVPEIKGLTYDQARHVLDDFNLSIEISDSIYDRKLQPGTIVESWPKAGAVVKRGRQVYVTVNAFSPKQIALSMPITGVSERQAVSYLESMGITSIRILPIPSQFEGLVESAEADGRPVSIGSVIPVTAAVTLRVGQVPQYSEEDDDEYAEDDLDDEFHNPTLDPDEEYDY